MYTAAYNKLQDTKLENFENLGICSGLTRGMNGSSSKLTCLFS